jgi:hypothetical protein
MELISARSSLTLLACEIEYTVATAAKVASTMPAAAHKVVFPDSSMSSLQKAHRFDQFFYCRIQSPAPATMARALLFGSIALGSVAVSGGFLSGDKMIGRSSAVRNERRPCGWNK